jgi:hypothetical protein
MCDNWMCDVHHLGYFAKYRYGFRLFVLSVPTACLENYPLSGVKPEGGGAPTKLPLSRRSSKQAASFVISGEYLAPAFLTFRSQGPGRWLFRRQRETDPLPNCRLRARDRLLGDAAAVTAMLDRLLDPATCLSAAPKFENQQDTPMQ